ncbi:MAG: hypothetical protein EAZ95_13250 [Bacteroidetes bacterium]|nr:MAG: hypothetical protein EAZ95_13250 [Bacteroidota bacterium]
MNRAYYSFTFTEPNEQDYYYFFTSIGKKGEVLKLTAFQLVHEGLYNVALVDFDAQTQDGDDTVVTNNQDMSKVLATVARILFDFLTRFPTVSILIEANSETKRKLYNRLIRNNLQDIPKEYEVLGVLHTEETEPFAHQDYIAIIIQSKTK